MRWFGRGVRTGTTQVDASRDGGMVIPSADELAPAAPAWRTILDNVDRAGWSSHLQLATSERNPHSLRGYALNLLRWLLFPVDQELDGQGADKPMFARLELRYAA